MSTKKLIILSIFFICPLFLRAYNTPEINNKIIEAIKKQSASIKNLQDLNIVTSQAFDGFSKTDPSRTIIEQVFSANLIASKQQKLNDSTTNLFKKAILNCEKTKQKELQIWASLQYGFYLYTYRKYENSFPFFSYCIKNLDKADDSEVISPGETYKKIAYFLSTVGDYHKAIEYLEIANKNANGDLVQLASITDALGLCYIRLNKPEEAEKYFNETLAHAKASNDELRYGKALGNLAEINLKNKNFTLALQRLQQDLTLSKKVGNVQNTVYALVLISKVYLASDNLSEATINLNLARKLASSQVQFKSDDYEINTLILEIAKKTGNVADELSARRNLETLKNQLRTLDSKDIIMRMGWNLEKAKLQASVETEKDKRAKESILKMGAIICCAFLSIIMILVVNRYKETIKSDKANFNNTVLAFKLDKVNSEQKLSTSTQTLAAYKTYLDEKNSQIELLEMEVEKANTSTSYEGKQHSEKILSLLNSHLLTNESWLAFKKSFIEAYPEYYQHLIQNFSGITDSNLRLIFLTKLGMNNVEISRILGLSIDAVKKAKQRLKKRYSELYDAIFEEQNKELNR
ncbi:tetratricopeptide repeat protein [Pedobacter changchengzhani]|uniref:Tetratricopeptide repeat protein n=1 Tax=Pedobacter changchengzhani TaxID=2529274 RepID=A0A4R5ML20_9SPHI|nr:tetratricopeptide repeat protein [Pedobacter changchengzhani]TDG36318.1 tetratricopeptide repeat protein [Pedobacter changchengzhani]